MQLAAMDDGRKEATTNRTGAQDEKPPPTKGSVFGRLGNPVDGAGKEKQDSSLKLQPVGKLKYSPRHQVSK